MKHYVVGLAFNAAADQLVVIRKNRPNWQAGKLNGPGGLIEPGETPLQAIQREFREETGVDISASSWTHFATLQDGLAIIDIFSCFNDLSLGATTRTDEPVLLLPLSDPRLQREGVPDLPVMLTHALNCDHPSVVQLGTCRLHKSEIATPPG